LQGLRGEAQVAADVGEGDEDDVEVERGDELGERQQGKGQGGSASYGCLNT
jgi:hypothetical protein